MRTSRCRPPIDVTADAAVFSATGPTAAPPLLQAKQRSIPNLGGGAKGWTPDFLSPKGAQRSFSRAVSGRGSGKDRQVLVGEPFFDLFLRERFAVDLDVGI